ncbi:MAG: NAD(+) diphosphatase [Clostridiales bacterium]|nr:NAD(+) diphosphatase [Clostridiales bacterium]
MLHDIEPHEYHCDFLLRRPASEQDYLLLFDGEQILLKRENGLATLPRLCDIADAERLARGLRYLFSVDNEAFFSMDISRGANAPGADAIIAGANEAWLYSPMRALREFQPPWLAFAAITGYQLHFWYEHNRYCGACGAEFEHSPHERALLCPCCGYLKYPETAVAVIVGIYDGDRLLLTRYANRPYQRYALVAGFVEIGESLEDALRREVYEEVGLRVKNLRYFASQPWGFSHCLLAGFFAEVHGSTEITLDGRELAEAVWMQREDICADQANISLTATMMAAFKDNLF